MVACECSCATRRELENSRPSAELELVTPMYPPRHDDHSVTALVTSKEIIMIVSLWSQGTASFHKQCSRRQPPTTVTVTAQDDTCEFLGALTPYIGGSRQFSAVSPSVS